MGKPERIDTMGAICPARRYARKSITLHRAERYQRSVRLVTDIEVTVPIIRRAVIGFMYSPFFIERK